MERPNLNLARKWRSRNFQEIIGQDLSVRILKNSLYLDYYFPVYLFAGQRGCGKTSMARIFASALNCNHLKEFQAAPTQALPCLKCDSCKAMAHGQHPDFIEIDAASHTGVDNVRQIIDAATLLPLLGRKKIYLIDEAHMLSKAAFNALLKILEEPPTCVLFILATTDVHKIIDTVKSRCFQLLFKPIESTALIDHLEVVCQAEQISYHKDALASIVRESDGSVRDALNALEQIRLASQEVTLQGVQEQFGHCDDAIIIELFGIVLKDDPKMLLEFFQQKMYGHVNPSYLYTAFAKCIRAALWQKYHCLQLDFNESADLIKQHTVQTSAGRLADILYTWYEHETLFLKTHDQLGFLQLLLLQLTQKKNSIHTSEQQVGGTTLQEEATIKISSHNVSNALAAEVSLVDQPVNQWNLFLQRIDSLHDPLLTSIFKQARIDASENKDKEIVVHFSQELLFFNEWLNDTAKLWEPIVKELYGNDSRLKFQFELPINANKPRSGVTKPGPSPDMQVPKSLESENYMKSNSKQKHNNKIHHVKSELCDISDKNLWKVTHDLLQEFPGVVYKEKIG